MSYTQYSQYGGNPYNDASNMEGGHGPQGNFAGQAPVGHEMTNLSTNSQYSNYAAPAAPTSSTLARRDFLDRVAFTTKQIDELPNLIGQLGRLHSEALNSAQSSPPAQLEGLITQIQQQNNQIRDSIKYLESDTVRTGDNNLLSVKNPQVKNLKNRFNQQLEAYRREEIDYKNKYQVQIAREYRIVNPNATEQEVEQASQMDWGNEGVFQQALRSNRSGQAASALGAVRARHNELEKIEMTLTELAAMFADMAQIVEAQEPVIQRTEENAIQTQEDVNKGNVEIDKANEHARRRRRLKWWCLLITVLIVIAIALGVGLGVGLAAKAGKTVTGP